MLAVHAGTCHALLVRHAGKSEHTSSKNHTDGRRIHHNYTSSRAGPQSTGDSYNRVEASAANSDLQHNNSNHLPHVLIQSLLGLIVN